MNLFHRWLVDEIDAWHREGLVDDEQAAKLRRRYPTAAERGWGRLVLSALGAIVFGLGIILFFAYNWADMPKLAKLAVVFSGLILTHGGGLWLAARKSQPAAVIEALHLLGTMLFGAGIWLISQIYHFADPYPEAYLVWGLGGLAMAWACQSAAQGFATLLLFFLWGINYTESATPLLESLAPTLLILFTVASLAWRLRATALSFFTAAALLVLLPYGIADHLEGLSLVLMLGVAVVFAQAEHLVQSPDLLRPVSRLAWAVYGFVLFLLSFEEVFQDINDKQPGSLEEWLLYLGPVVLALALLVVTEINRRGVHRPAIGLDRFETALVAGTLIVTPFLPLLPNKYSGGVMAFSSLVLISHGVALILRGSRHQSVLRVCVGCMAVCSVGMVRFADLFESLLMRSLAFLLLGAGLFAVGHFYQRYKQPAETDHV